MFKTAKIEFKNIIFSIGTIVGIFLIFLLMNLSADGGISQVETGESKSFIYEILHYSKNDMLKYPQIYYPTDIFIGALIGKYTLFFLPLCVSITSITLFCSQRKGKFYYYEVSRVPLNKYIMGKIIADCLACMFIVYAGLLLFWLELQFVVPSVNDFISKYGYEAMLKTYVCRHSILGGITKPETSFLYILSACFFISVFAAIEALTVRLLCHIFKFDKFAGLTGTILLYGFLDEVFISLATSNMSWSMLSPRSLIAPDISLFFSKDALHFMIYIIYISVLLVGIILLNVYLDKRGMSHDE